MALIKQSRRQARFDALFTGAAATSWAAAAIGAILFAPAAARADISDSVVHLFSNSDENTVGIYPVGRPIQGPDGCLYGVTVVTGKYDYYGGAIYKIPPGGKIQVLYNFYDTSAPDNGFGPSSILIGRDGNIYGTTYYGGNSASNDVTGNGAGIIFKLTPAGEFTKLHDFEGGDGDYPYGGIVQGSDGAIYGTTLQGGDDFSFDPDDGEPGGGVFYRCTTDGNFSVLHYFNPPTEPLTSDGTHPQADLTVGGDGNIYGTTESGGTANQGTAYKMTIGGQETILHTFSGPTAPFQYNNPAGGLIQGANGLLYGMTEGGSAYFGAIYSMTTAGHKFTLLHSFGDGNTPQDGEQPEASLALGGDGNFYGVTERGGIPDTSTPYTPYSGYGTLFQMTPAGAVTILHRFNASEAVYPSTTLTQGFDGGLYGLASGGQYPTPDYVNVTLYRAATTLPAASGTLSAFTLSKSSASGGGQHVDGTVTLKAPAGPGGVKVLLSSNNSAKVVLDAYALVPEGKTVTSFRVTPRPVSAPTQVEIVVETGTAAIGAPLTITPAAPVASLSADQPTGTGGEYTPNITLTLASSAPAGGERVAITTTDNNAADVPLTVFVPAGATTATFQATSHTVNSATMVTITAISDGVSKSITLTVNAAS